MLLNSGTIFFILQLYRHFHKIGDSYQFLNIGMKGFIFVLDFLSNHNFIVGRDCFEVSLSNSSYKFLSRSQSHNLYHDVLIRDKSGQFDHLSCQIDDFNRLAHIKNVVRPLPIAPASRTTAGLEWS
jgi:hypothetical protein